MHKTAILALEDGSVFEGVSIGADLDAVGEVVFNTAMTGYQEILTDPSYARQIVTLTYPHIGNTGTNAEDLESVAVHAAGLIIRDLPRRYSNWRASESLSDYLCRHNKPAIAEIDTRRLTRHLRENGSMSACIFPGTAGNANECIERARQFPGLAGLDLAKTVSCLEPYQWQAGSWSLTKGQDGGTAETTPRSNQDLHVVAMDFGVKHNILRMLADRGCHITVVPAETDAATILSLKPDGVFLSNGPGDPEPCDYAITAIKQLLGTGVPIFGICLGHQLLGLASGARSLKMKFGHHGANHPVQDVASGSVMITSQNHGFAIDESSLGSNLEVTHKSLFDKTLQGIRRRDVPAFSFQGHPEASPGPHDLAPLFDQFIELIKNAQINQPNRGLWSDLKHADLADD